MTALLDSVEEVTAAFLTGLLRRAGSDTTADDVVETDRQERRERHLPTNPGGTP